LTEIGPACHPWRVRSRRPTDWPFETQSACRAVFGSFVAGVFCPGRRAGRRHIEVAEGKAGAIENGGMHTSVDRERLPFGAGEAGRDEWRQARVCSRRVRFAVMVAAMVCVRLPSGVADPERREGMARVV